MRKMQGVYTPLEEVLTYLFQTNPNQQKVYERGFIHGRTNINRCRRDELLSRRKGYGYTFYQGKRPGNQQKEGAEASYHKVRSGRISQERNMKNRKEQEALGIVLDAVIVVLLPIAIFGIWFLTHVRWWELGA